MASLRSALTRGGGLETSATTSDEGTGCPHPTDQFKVVRHRAPDPWGRQLESEMEGWALDPHPQPEAGLLVPQYPWSSQDP